MIVYIRRVGSVVVADARACRNADNWSRVGVVGGRKEEVCRCGWWQRGRGLSRRFDGECAAEKRKLVKLMVKE